MDQAEFEKIYHEFADAIFRYLYFKLANRERAKELTQDVFSNFWQYLQKGNAVEHPKAFLYRSAANIFINEIRKGNKEISLNQLLDTGFDIPDQKANVSEIVFQNEVLEKIRSIDPQYRDVLLMRYVEGMQVQEIAQILNRKENTVSVQIKRGLEKIKKIYD